MIVEVFRTDVQHPDDSRELIRHLHESIYAHRISFDLEDCDRVLRLEAKLIEPGKVIALLKEAGFKCELMN